MKVVLLLLLLCGFSYSLSAQKEANIWYFGQNAGLDFNTNCQPTALDDSRIGADGGSATLSDGKTGQLLFYTNGLDVWNRKHGLMPNGRYGPDRGFIFPNQGSLIVPSPGNTFLYYLFRMAETRLPPNSAAYFARLSFSLIDMRLDGGRGDVVVAGKDSVLTDGLAARLTGIPHANGRDYWVLTHQFNSNAFLVYPVTSAGVGKADTIRIGSTYRNQEVEGFLKASPNGRRLAASATNSTARPFDLFDFDAATGKISNYVNLGNVRWQYGVSFSPDNTKLYVTNQTIVDADLSTELIRQYDLTAGSTERIIASGKSIIYQNPDTNIPYQGRQARNGFHSPSLQIGPDGRIYAAADYSNGVDGGTCLNCTRHLIIINNPNAPGFACDVQSQVAELGSGSVGDSNDFPNFMQHYFNGLEPKDCTFDRNDECTDTNVQIFPNPAKDVLEILINDICFTAYTLRVINAAGQVLATHQVTTPRSQKLDVAHFAMGIYFAELRFANRTTVKRFVKH